MLPSISSGVGGHFQWSFWVSGGLGCVWSPAMWAALVCPKRSFYGSMPRLLQLHHPFTWADKSITYLGVQLTKSVKSLFSTNFKPLVTEHIDTQSLTKQELTWPGRLAAFKTMHLPQILYLFRTLPIPIPLSFFRSLKLYLKNVSGRAKNPDMHTRNS